MKTILIIGGYGGVGKIIARLLLSEADCRVVIAGRNKEKAEAFTESLNKEFSNRTAARWVDANDPKSVEAGLSGVDLVLVSTTSPESAPEIARSALRANCDYLDILVHQENYARLQSLEEEVKRSGRVFITQAGFHPGLPAVFIRKAAGYFDQYERAVVSMAMNARFKSQESVIELINLTKEMNSEIFKNGSWQKADYSDSITTDFGPPFGKRQCFPLGMEELKTLPEKFGLKETGAYVSGFNWFTDGIVFPLIIILHKIKKNSGTRFLKWLMYWSVNIFSPKMEHVTFVLDAQGKMGEKDRTVRVAADHDDPYFFTAAPVISCIKQVLDGTIAPGLHLMGLAVDPDRLFSDMEKIGVRVRTDIND